MSTVTLNSNAFVLFIEVYHKVRIFWTEKVIKYF